MISPNLCWDTVMEIGTLWIFQANSEKNKITDVTQLTKVDDIPAARMLNPFSTSET